MDQLEAFRILASADRQLVLHELLEGNESTDIAELSRQVAARRHRLPPEKLGASEIEHAHVRLVHAHLPKLEEENVVDVNWDDSELSLVDDEAVDRLFAAAEELDSWPPNDLLDRPQRGR